MIINRNILQLLNKTNKSILLLGPRQAGKSTLIAQLSPELSINLADESEFLAFSRNPSEIKERLAAKKYETVLIDEVQRLPSLLNTLQTILDRRSPKPPRFFLTGSSARKLKRGQANLLPGRLLQFELGPCVYSELRGNFDLSKALAYGTLPGIYLEENEFDRRKTLETYAAIYLREEIQSEALTRNIEGFSRFIYAAAAKNGQFLDFSKLASDAAVERKTTMRFFEILEETMLVNRLEAFTSSTYKRLIKHPRYFFFDSGVLNALLGSFSLSTDRIGALFETFVYIQLSNTLKSQDRKFRLSNYRTSNDAEVDFILELDNETYAIEVKASKNIGKHDFSGFHSFAEFYGKSHHRLIVYLGEHAKVMQDGIEILPFIDFIERFS